MNPRTDISGFTIVRNATLLDYPLEESVESILPLCREVIINCGDSDDDTADRCARLQAKHPGKIQVFPTVWQRENQKGGFQLKSQTDFALSKCQYAWCLYLQADEVLHEKDYECLRTSQDIANKNDAVDGILFDYLHFYGSYAYTIHGRNWYRKEVRLFKNGRGIEAFRDAQGFRRNGERLRVVASGAQVFHYGYVRPPASLLKKTQQMAQWWGEKPKEEEKDMQWVRHVGLRAFRAGHPGVMRERVTRYPTEFDPTKCPRRWDKDEIKNLATLIWESLVPYRIGEFRNYEIV